MTFHMTYCSTPVHSRNVFRLNIPLNNLPTYFLKCKFNLYRVMDNIVEVQNYCLKKKKSKKNILKVRRQCIIDV